MFGSRPYELLYNAHRLRSAVIFHISWLVDNKSNDNEDNENDELFFALLHCVQYVLYDKPTISILQYFMRDAVWCIYVCSVPHSKYSIHTEREIHRRQYKRT